MKALDDQRRNLRRTLIALGGSALFHLLVLVAFLQAGINAYRLPTPPEPPSPPLEVEIAPPDILPPVVTPSRRFTAPETSTPPQTAASPPLQPQPPQIVQPPQPQAAPAPPRPVIVRPLVTQTAPPAPTEARRLTPQTLINPALPTLEAPAPAPAPVPAPAPPAPSRAPPAPAQAVTPAPLTPRLNIHKSEHEAPAGTPTLPMAPSPTPSPGRTPAGGGAPNGGGGGGGGAPSRLQGLTPYPAGVLPNGGPGLRGSLVGCANAQAVGLSAVERAHCESRFGASLGGAPKLDPIPAERRAAFDRELERAERDRAYRNSSTAAGDTTAPGGISPQQSGTHVRLPP